MANLATALDQLFSRLRRRPAQTETEAVKPAEASVGEIFVLPGHYWSGGDEAAGVVREDDPLLQPDLIPPPKA